LHVAGQHIALAQMGGGRLLFDHPVALADEAGEVTMYVHGSTPGTPPETTRWRVRLRGDGIARREVPAELELIR
ncbi:MAG: hypothetical protein HKL95_07335, partial [Phycisphaerae bacterium]|nr:hypothetical protein [Phycisphaerae bacterium]